MMPTRIRELMELGLSPFSGLEFTTAADPLDGSTISAF